MCYLKEMTLNEETTLCYCQKDSVLLCPEGTVYYGGKETVLLRTGQCITEEKAVCYLGEMTITEERTVYY